MSVNLPLNSKFSLKKELPCREETYFLLQLEVRKHMHLAILLFLDQLLINQN